MATNISGTLGVDKIDPAATTAITASTAEAETGTDNTKFITPLRLREGVNATGTAPLYACRAWVNFDGTGTVSIRASGNVSGITDNGTGNYTVNFTTAMPDANYAFTVGYSKTDNSVGNSFAFPRAADTQSTTQLQIRTWNGSTPNASDTARVNIAIFR